MILIYCYDAYCGWCFGFSNVINRIANYYVDTFSVTVISGGMILPKEPRHISVSASYILDAYKHVEQTAGMKFGDDYLWHLRNTDKSDWYPNSEKPAIALAIIKEHNSDKALSFATDLQYSLFVEGRDLTDDEAYRHLLGKYDLDADSFYKDLHSELFKNKAYEDFELVQRLRVDGFPAVFLQTSENKFYQLTKGYADYETLKSRIDTVLSDNQ